MAVHVVSIENAHQLGDVIPSMLRLRYREFRARQSYDIPTFKDMEYDAYDTPAAVYVVWRDNHGTVRGCSRMAPTDRAYMIRDLWPSIVTAFPLPGQADIWESSRFCVDSTCPAGTRQRIKLEILQAKIEYALAVKIRGMIGVMPPLIWRAVFINSGWPVDHIGPVTVLPDGEKVVAGWIHVHSDILGRVQARTNLPHSLLDGLPDEKRSGLSYAWGTGSLRRALFRRKYFNVGRAPKRFIRGPGRLDHRHRIHLKGFARIPASKQVAGSVP